MKHYICNPTLWGGVCLTIDIAKLPASSHSFLCLNYFAEKKSCGSISHRGIPTFQLKVKIRVSK